MRIITGRARGKKLASAEGLNTRPTASRVKQAVFNIIQFDIEGRTALDLFCGSGQMGLEAVSRGARSCVFVETDRRAIDVTRANIKTCALDAECRVEQCDVLGFIARQSAQIFGLIFLDPPYSGALTAHTIEAITRFDILAQGGIIVCESAKETILPELAPPYFLKREYIYGGTKITVMSKG